MTEADSSAILLPPAVRGFVEARTGDAVFVVGPDYRIVYWDEEAAFLTGFSSEQMVGRRCFEAVLGEREEGEPVCAYGCSVMRLAQVGRPVSSYEMRLTRASGEKHWVSVSILSLDSESGPYLVHLLRDSQKTHETLELARSLIRLSRKEEHPGGDARPGAGGTRVAQVTPLTPRQLEVLGLLAEGKSAKEIRGELYLSEATVRNHIRSLLKALGAHSQLEALAKAREAGLLPG